MAVDRQRQPRTATGLDWRGASLIRATRLREAGIAKGRRGFALSDGVDRHAGRRHLPVAGRDGAASHRGDERFFGAAKGCTRVFALMLSAGPRPRVRVPRCGDCRIAVYRRHARNPSLGYGTLAGRRRRGADLRCLLCRRPATWRPLVIRPRFSVRSIPARTGALPARA